MTSILADIKIVYDVIGLKAGDSTCFCCVPTVVDVAIVG